MWRYPVSDEKPPEAKKPGPSKKAMIGWAVSLTLVLLVAFAPRASAGEQEVPPQTVPKKRIRMEARKIREKLAGILKRLGDDSWRVREKASEELVALRAKAVPLIAEHVNHRDPEVAMRVKQGLSRLYGGTGRALEGLRLSAALVGRKPRPGEAVTLWLTITNVSDHDIHIFQYFWNLVLQPKSRDVSDHARVVGATTPATLTAQDFLRLKPGQSVGYLMDADPLKRAKGAAAVRAYLEISLPDKARKIIKGKVFSGSSELVSGPIEMTYAAEAAPADPQAAALVAELLKGKAEAKAKLKAGLKDKKAGKAALAALRAGLRLADADQRWKVFTFICSNPHPSLEDDVVDFLARYGPRMKNEGPMLKGVRALRDVLPPERRLVFLHRVALTMLHDWRSVSALASPYSVSSDPKERGLAAKLFLLLHARGDRQPDVMNWLALELHSTSDTKLRDRKRARKLAEMAVKASPGDAQYQLTLACLAGDRKKVEKLARAATTPGKQNSIAWDLATNFPTGSWHSAVALEIGAKALAGTKPEDQMRRYCLDTVAVCHAAVGDYARALELEKQALRKHRPGDGFRRDYAVRVARFVALAHAGKDERPAMALASPKLRSAGARDALLKSLKSEKDSLVRAEIVRLLRTCYGKDPKVKEALK